MRNVGNLYCFGRRRRWHTIYTFILYCALTSLANALFVSAAGTFVRLLPNSIDEKVMSVFDDPLSVSASFWFEKGLLMRSTWRSSMVTFAITETRPRSAVTKRRKQAKEIPKEIHHHRRHHLHSVSQRKSPKEFCRVDRSNCSNRRLWKLRAKEKILPSTAVKKKGISQPGVPNPPSTVQKSKYAPPCGSFLTLPIRKSAGRSKLRHLPFHIQHVFCTRISVRLFISPVRYSSPPYPTDQ